MGKRIAETDIAKGIGIILVVIGHAFPDSTQLVSGSFSYILYRMIYSFHMPFFFFVSGLVSAGIVGVSGRSEKVSQIKKKAMRLLIPYFVIGAIFVPLRIVFGKFARFTYDMSKLYTVFLGNNPCGQLWFLYVLFFFSLTAILFSTKKNIKFLLAGSLAVTCLSKLVTVRYDGISWYNSLFMLFFYYLGLFLSQHHDKVYRYMKPKGLLFALPAFALSFYGFMMTGEHYLMKILTSVTGICMILCLSALVQMFKISGLKWLLTEIGGYSMDVYILHSPMGLVWRVLILKLLGLNSIIYSLVYVFSGVFIAYLISRFIIRKVPAFSFLLFGMTSSPKKRITTK